MARALSHDTKLIVMDEPSAALDQQEVKTLFKVIRDLTAQGVAVVYISHRLEEIRQVGDRVTVLKDGRTVATDLPAKTTATPELIRRMTGRDIEYVFPDRPTTATKSEVVLSVVGPQCPQGVRRRQLRRRRRRDRRPRRAGRLRSVRDPRSRLRRSQAVQRHRVRRRQAAPGGFGRRRGQGGHRSGTRGAQEPGPAARPVGGPEHHRVQSESLRSGRVPQRLGGARRRPRSGPRHSTCDPQG